MKLEPSAAVAACITCGVGGGFEVAHGVLLQVPQQRRVRAHLHRVRLKHLADTRTGGVSTDGTHRTGVRRTTEVRGGQKHYQKVNSN